MQPLPRGIGPALTQLLPALRTRPHPSLASESAYDIRLPLAMETLQPGRDVRASFRSPDHSRPPLRAEVTRRAVPASSLPFQQINAFHAHRHAIARRPVATLRSSGADRPFPIDRAMIIGFR